MKYILVPVFKFLGSLFVLLVNLFYFIFFYIITIIWNLELMTWGDLLVSVHKSSTSEGYIEDCDILELRNEKFWKTMKRWINFEYMIFKI